MDIKLRARLSAYSKIESISSIANNMPDASATEVGHVVGVGDNGQYTLFPPVGQAEVESLFDGSHRDVTTTKDDINTLFEPKQKPESVSKDEIATLFTKNQKPSAVTKDEVETLFETTDNDVADKDDIDTLFDEDGNEIGTVSFDEIASLFKKKK